MYKKILFSSIIFLLFILSATALTFGFLLHKKIKMPWMFSVLILGKILAPFSLFSEIVNSEEFSFLSTLGLMGFLFLTGLNIDLKKIKAVKGYIVLSTFSLILAEGVSIAMILYYLFPADVSNSLIIAFVIGLGYGRIGEAVLLAILMEFKEEHTDFGQITLGISVFDDIFEILLIGLLPFLLTLKSQGGVSAAPVNPLFLILNLIGMIILTIINVKFGKKIQSFIAKKKKLTTIPFIIPFVILSTLFLLFRYQVLPPKI